MRKNECKSHFKNTEFKSDNVSGELAESRSVRVDSKKNNVALHKIDSRDFIESKRADSKKETSQNILDSKNDADSKTSQNNVESSLQDIIDSKKSIESVPLDSKSTAQDSTKAQAKIESNLQNMLDSKNDAVSKISQNNIESSLQDIIDSKKSIESVSLDSKSTAQDSTKAQAKIESNLQNMLDSKIQDSIKSIKTQENIESTKQDSKNSQNTPNSRNNIESKPTQDSIKTKEKTESKSKDDALEHVLNPVGENLTFTTKKGLFNKIKKRLSALAKLPPLRKSENQKELKDVLSEKGVSRRDFMKWAAVITASLGLPATFAPLTMRAAELAGRVPLIWLHMAECTGCSESLLRSEDPGIDSIIFDYVSLEYHETIMVASGHQAEKSLEDAIKTYAGRYILMVEGGIPKNTEYFLTIGAHARTGAEECRHAAEGAAAIFAIGTCSSFGGVQAAAPNPTNANPLSEIITKHVINVPGCPPSEKNIVGSLMHYVLFGELPALDAFNRPKWAYGLRIHDLCERRGRFDAGEFVQSFGDENAKKGYCLYKVGCKGPYTFNNCSKLRFNSHTNWPIGAGHGCIGCSEPRFWDTMSPFEVPLGNRYQTAFRGAGADKSADSVGIVLLGATAIGIAAHAMISSGIKPK